MCLHSLYHFTESIAPYLLFKLFIGNLKDIEISDMYNLLYVQAYEYLKEMFDEPFVHKVWDKKVQSLVSMIMDKYTIINIVLKTKN